MTLRNSTAPSIPREIRATGWRALAIALLYPFRRVAAERSINRKSPEEIADAA